MMQSNNKEIEVKNNGIDLTETGTFGAKKKYDYPFHADSYEYWLFKVPNDEKLRILLEKFNQNDGYFRSHSIEHLIETIFNSSKRQFLEKKQYAEKRINDIPEIKQQYVIDEKLKTFNEIEELKKVLKGSEPSDDCFLDLKQSKEIFLEYTFPPLGFKSVKEIEIYLLSLIAYRGNLLYINYLKQLSAPEPKKIEKKKPTKNIDNLNKIDLDIIGHFNEGMKTCKGDEKKALQYTLKAMGTKKYDMVFYNREINRVRIRLERMGKWETKNHKKTTEYVV